MRQFLLAVAVLVFASWAEARWDMNLKNIRTTDDALTSASCFTESDGTGWAIKVKSSGQVSGSITIQSVAAAALMTVAPAASATWVLGTGSAVVGQVLLAQGPAASVSLMSDVVVVLDTLTASETAYTANDVFGTEVRLEFANAARAAGGAGTILSAVLVDDKQLHATSDFRLLLFDETFGCSADNGAIAVSATTYATLVGVIDFTDNAGTNTSFDDGVVGGVIAAFNPIAFKLDAGDTSLFGVLVIEGASDYAAADTVNVILGIKRE